MLSITNQVKILYETPTTIVVEVKMESSLLQASLDANRNGYGNPTELTWDD